MGVVGEHHQQRKALNELSRRLNAMAARQHGCYGNNATTGRMIFSLVTSRRREASCLACRLMEGCCIGLSFFALYAFLHRGLTCEFGLILVGRLLRFTGGCF